MLLSENVKMQKLLFFYLCHLLYCFKQREAEQSATVCFISCDPKIGDCMCSDMDAWETEEKCPEMTKK